MRVTGALNTFRTRPAHAEHTFQARRIRYVRVSILTGCWFGRVWNAPITCAKRAWSAHETHTARLWRVPNVSGTYDKRTPKL